MILIPGQEGRRLSRRLLRDFVQALDHHILEQVFFDSLGSELAFYIPNGLLGYPIDKYPSSND
jgi:hypothetical protein